MRICTALTLPLVVAAIAVTAAFSGSSPEDQAWAAYPPGMNGKIVFTSTRDGHSDIWMMNTDGSGQANLTTDQPPALHPRWSPDGTKIAYELDVYDDDTDYDIWVMNIDGSGKIGVAEGAGGEYDPVWSPDGTKILFHDGDNIWQMDADGSDQVQLTNHPEFECCPELSPDGSRIFFDSTRDGDRHIWRMSTDGSSVVPQPGSIDGDLGVSVSPDGQRLAFYNAGDIYTMNVNGSERQNITDNDFNEHSPAWTADGTQIIYSSEEFVDETGQIAIMNPDGTGRQNLSNSPGSDTDPDMQVISPIAWGDVDCNDLVDPIDGLKLLRHDAGLEVAQNEPCPEVGDLLDGGLQFGDLDCDELVNPVDALKTLRHDAGLEVAQEDGCPEPGEIVSP